MTTREASREESVAEAEFERTMHTGWQFHATSPAISISMGPARAGLSGCATARSDILRLASTDRVAQFRHSRICIMRQINPQHPKNGTRTRARSNRQHIMDCEVTKTRGLLFPRKDIDSACHEFGLADITTELAHSPYS